MNLKQFFKIFLKDRNYKKNE
mgnify:CR=1